MKKYYKMLYEAFEGKTYRWNKKRIDFTQLGYSHPFCGEKYYQADNEFKFMLVGRATNGWNVEVPLSNAFDFANEMDSRVKRLGFDWICEDNGKLCNIEKEYYLKRSAFWRTAENVWRGLSRLEEVRWVESIVWSNLYKVAPAEQGNPTTSMCRVQQKICKNLLQKEIELYKPTHIILVTGLDWVEWCGEDSFISIFENSQKTEEKFVVGTAYYNLADDKKIPVVITRRPEFCQEEMFVKSVLEWFGKL